MGFILYVTISDFQPYQLKYINLNEVKIGLEKQRFLNTPNNPSASPGIQNCNAVLSA